MIFIKLMKIVTFGLCLLPSNMFSMENPRSKGSNQEDSNFNFAYLLYGAPVQCPYDDVLKKNVFIGNDEFVEKLLKAKKFDQQTLDLALGIAVERRHTNLMLLLLGNKAHPISAFYCLKHALKINGRHVRENRNLYLQIFGVLHEKMQVHLMDAINDANPLTVYLLLDAGVDPNGIFVRAKDGKNALHCAARLKDPVQAGTIIELLLQAGAVLDDPYFIEHDSISSAHPHYIGVRRFVQAIARTLDAQSPFKK